MKKISKKLMAIILSATMTIPAMIGGLTVNAQTIGVPAGKGDESIEMLWASSFEDDEEVIADNFVENELHEAKGTQNITAKIVDRLPGDITYMVDLDSITGSSDNNAEAKIMIFDGSTETKWLTFDARPVHVQFKLKDGAEKVVKRYAISSANDSQERDPKNWQFQARNSDSDSWVTLDEQSNFMFTARYQQRIFELDNTTAYNQYRLNITGIRNDSTTSMQLSELTLLTDDPADDEVFEDNMTTAICNGPASTWNQIANQGWSGSRALEAFAAHVTGDRGYAYNTIFKDLDILIEEDTYFSYVIFPTMSNGEEYDYNFTQMHMMVDILFDTGEYLSDLDAYDQNGTRMDANSQGESKMLMTQQWNQIYTKLGEVAAGKTVKEIIIAYDKKDNPEADGINFRTLFDDIKFYNKEETVYEELADYVYTLRGTNDNSAFSRGLTGPNTNVPFGFNFWTPTTNFNNNQIYDYQKDYILYMQTSHEPSIWMGDRGNWQIMANTSIGANTNTFNFNTTAMRSYYSHDNEVAKAHYYSIEFDKDRGAAQGSKLELTPTDHGAVVRVSFDADVQNRNIIFDAVRSDSTTSGGDFNYLGDGEFTAKANYIGNSGYGATPLFVYGKFNVTPEDVTKNGTKGIARFGSNVDEVEVKVATSYIGYDQAKTNLELEIADNESFDDIYEQAYQAWNEKLNIVTGIKESGATEEELISYYSNMYRTFSFPNNMSEQTGIDDNGEAIWSYKSPYAGSTLQQRFDAEPVQADYKIYVNNGFWDTYRTAWSAYALLIPDMATELLNGLTQHYLDCDWIPRWIAPGNAPMMVGTSSDVIFADAYVKGIDFDIENAYASSIRNAATRPENLGLGGRNDIERSVFNGYAAGGGQNFSWSIEGYINDYGIANMAAKLAEEETDPVKKADYEAEAEYYYNRCLNYVLLFDGSGETVEDKWFKGKELNGSWTTGSFTDGKFDPLFWGSDYTETNAYNMAVSVVHDGKGLANIYGGEDELEKKLDTIFTTNAGYNGYGANNGVGGIHEQKEGREVKMGQFSFNNQPSHHIPYMYNFTNNPSKTQKYVRETLDRMFVGSSFGQGYIGDEDNGEMSAWYVFSALGFYPLEVGNDEYAIGSPLFKNAVLNLENGNTFEVKAPQNSKENVYIQNAYLNGVEYNKTYIKHEDILAGGTLEFVMGSEPSDWGTDEDSAPFSMTARDDDEVANPSMDMIEAGSKVEKTDEFDSTDKTFFSTIRTDIDGIQSVIDNNSTTGTKFADDSDVSTIVFDFTKGQKVELVTLTSSKNVAAPEGMKIYGAYDGEDWILLNEYENLEFRWSYYTRPFAIAEDDRNLYQHYKIELVGGEGLAEIELIGDKDDSINVDDLAGILAYSKEVHKSDQMQEAAYKDIKVELFRVNLTAEYVLDRALNAGENISEALKTEVEDAYNGIRAVIAKIATLRYLPLGEKLEMETFDDAHSNISIDDSETTDGDRIKNIGGTLNGTWVKYSNVVFEETATGMTIRYSVQAGEGGNIHIYLNEKGSQEARVHTEHVTETGPRWATYVTREITLEKPIEPGVYDVYFEFMKTANSYTANVDWVTFTGGSQVDKSELEALIEECKLIEKGSYTEASWANFQGVLADAIEVLENDEASVAQVNYALMLLKVAKGALDNKGDVDALEYFVQRAEKAVTDGEVDKAVEQVQIDFRAALDNAKYVLEHIEDFDGETITRVTEELIKQLHRLGVQIGDKTYLQNLYDLLKDVDQSKYADGELKDEFNEALDFALEVLGDGNALQELIDEAVERLTKAFEALQDAVDKSELKKAIDRANEIKSRLDDYVAAGQAEFLIALEHAEKVYAADDVTQTLVNNAALTLNIAIGELRLKANKANLEEVLDKADSLDYSLYTDDSVAAFKAVMARAVEVYNNEELSVDEQELVDEMTVEMAAAFSLLQLKDDGGEETPGTGDTDTEDTNPGTSDPKDPKPGESESDTQKPGGGTGSTNAGGKSSSGKSKVKTGDSGSIMIMFLILVISGSGLYLVSKKRRIEK